MGIQGAMLGWALACLAVTVVLIARAGRLGREKTAGRLVIIGLVMYAGEEPLLTLFWGMSSPDADKDGMAPLITPLARAHVLDTATFGTALFVLLGWIALTAFRRHERWAFQVLAAGWVLAATTTVVTSLAIHSRGLPVPTPGGSAEGSGFGWEQLPVGLLAWAAGLWIVRSSRRAPETAQSGP